MIVDAEGRFISQRVQPALTRLKVDLTGDILTIANPEGERVSIPNVPETGRGVRVVVWKDTVSAIEADHTASDFISSYLGATSRLVYMPDDSIREVDPVYSRAGDHVSFADGYPILMTTTASLENLNERLDESIPMNRFRPNLVISGGKAWEEDNWKAITIDGVTYRCAKPSARCGVITVDQTSGLRQKEPLRALAAFRKKDSKVYFGINLIPDTLAEIGVGQSVFEHFEGIGG